jgi:hypothetical protein
VTRHPPSASAPSHADFTSVFSRPFAVDDLSEGPVELHIDASEAECAAIARAFDLPALHALAADVEVVEAHGAVHVQGQLRARIQQKCVVSLDLFESDVVEEIAVDFADPAVVAKAEAAWLVRSDDEEDALEPLHEPPDPIINGRIDLGAVIVEFLVLGLDPYPRKEGAVFAGGDDSGEQRASPFAVLSQLKNKNSQV